MNVVCSLKRFKPWGEAVKVFEKIEMANKLGDLESYLEGLYGDSIDGGELNDILCGYIDIGLLNALGLNDDLDESINEEASDEVYDIVRQELLDVMKGYGWVELDQLQDYIKDRGVDISDEELLHVADTCLKYSRIYDAKELIDMNANLEDIENASGKVIVVIPLKKKVAVEEALDLNKLNATLNALID